MNGKARLAGFALCAVAVLTVPSAGAATGTGRVTKVVDGDTIRVKLRARTVTVNLAGGCPASLGKLRSLLPRGTRVRVKGRYVYRGSRQINRSLRAVCAAPPAAPTPAPTAGPAPTPSPTVAPTPTPGPVDSAENRAALDAALRGFKFAVHDTGTGFSQDRVFHWCSAGGFTYERTLVSGAGNEYEREDGTWKVKSVTRREGKNVEGNVEVTSGPQGEAPTTGFIYAGLTSDGTGFVRVNGEDRLATRAATNMC